MQILFPVLAAILQASSLLVDKTILTIRRMSFKAYIGTSFPLIFLITLALFLAARPPLAWENFYGNFGVLLLVAIGLTVGGNLMFYRALKTDRLGEIETLSLLAAIPTILVSGIIFTDERKFTILIPALIASCAVVWAHWERHHFKIAHGTLFYLLWALIAGPVAAAVLKVILTVWNPISFELIRSGVVALIFGYLYFERPRFVPPRAIPFLILTNLFTVFAGIFLLFSYQRSGIIYTVLLFSLQPLLVYFGSVVFLKEPIHWKKMVAFFIVLIAIGVAQIM